MIWKCEFSFKHYFEVLKHAKESYALGTICEFHKLKRKKKFILLRHDVDFSLDHALLFAKEEAKQNIFSTYFVLLSNPFYNALSEDGFKKIQMISKLGHEIGLHYDTSILNKVKSNILSHILLESKLLSNIIGKKIVSVAQHNPIITQKMKTKINSHFIDARSSMISETATFLSDSLQNWREGCMCTHVDKIDRLQISTHPIWWSKNPIHRKKIMMEIENFHIKKIHGEFIIMKEKQIDYCKKINLKS